MDKLKMVKDKFGRLKKHIFLTTFPHLIEDVLCVISTNFILLSLVLSHISKQL